jgi:hypothetical protein
MVRLSKVKLSKTRLVLPDCLSLLESQVQARFVAAPSSAAAAPAAEGVVPWARVREVSLHLVFFAESLFFFDLNENNKWI